MRKLGRMSGLSHVKSYLICQLKSLALVNFLKNLLLDASQKRTVFALSIFQGFHFNAHGLAPIIFAFRREAELKLELIYHTTFV